MRYREAEKLDVPDMARLRAMEWETQAYWERRISGYLNGELHPQQARSARVSYVAVQGDSLVGFIAGHLTRRYACDGELEWINIVPELRGQDVASELIRLLAHWFAEQNASKVCVDVEPQNIPARRFYMRHGAEKLNEHWLVWNDIKVVLGQQ